MKRANLHRTVRTWHRRLGVVIGIQLFAWTAGGIYFSWFHIDNVHGDYEVADGAVADLPKLQDVELLSDILQRSSIENIESVRLRSLLGRPVIEVEGRDQIPEVFDAQSGVLLSPITEAMAGEIADADFAPDARIIDIALITERPSEYNGPLPAYRVSYSNRKHTNLYVSAATGSVTARRNSIWRGFDFLWMLHILDFADRSDINNWLLRCLSVLAMITIVSGYLLWILSSRFLWR